MTEGFIGLQRRRTKVSYGLELVHNSSFIFLLLLAHILIPVLTKKDYISSFLFSGLKSNEFCIEQCIIEAVILSRLVIHMS